MWDDIDKRAEEGSYSSRSEYFRTRLEAGESTIQSLSPGGDDQEGNQIASELEEIIHQALDTELQPAQQIQETVAEHYKEKVSDWLISAAENESSPIERSGLAFRVENE